MSTDIITIDKVDGLKKFDQQGGLADIYILPPDKLIKIYTSDCLADSVKMSERLEKIKKSDQSYEDLKEFCAVPEFLVQRMDNRQYVGFQMRHFKDFEQLGTLSSLEYCLKKKITVRQIIHVFIALHDCLTKIHSKGFLVGDLNEDNILFKLANKKASLAFVDTDSWAVNLPGLILPSTAKTKTFSHPELDREDAKLKQYHDWYSYTVLLARSLIKNDPFNLGQLDSASRKGISGTCQDNGVTCWDPRMRLKENEKMYIFRFGQQLTAAIQNWLKGDQRGAFSKKTLVKFLEGLTWCKCMLEVHIDHAVCPRCGGKLLPMRQPLNPTTDSSKNKPQTDPTLQPSIDKLVLYGG